MSLVNLAAFRGLALLVMINDIDFLDLHDSFDTTELHHEHTVVALPLLGIIFSAWPYLLKSRDGLPMDDRSEVPVP